MMRAKSLLTHLHLLLALLAFIAMIGGPLAGFSQARGFSSVIVEETEDGSERTSSNGSTSPVSAVPSARRRFEPPTADRSVDDLHPASRHVPCVAAAHPPRPNPCWLRPIRC
jgi:hypothetical protein